MLNKGPIKSALAMFLLLVFCLAAPAFATDFQEGQVWSYQTRPGEERSRLYIVRIDRDIAKRPIFHIYLDGLKLKNPLMQGGVQDHLAHAPVSQESLEASVEKLLKTGGPMPNISEGYTAWLLAFSQRQAGVFTMPVKDIVQYIEDQFSKAK